jgi:hypothetical protein
MPSEKINFTETTRMHHSCNVDTDECTCTPTADTRPGVRVNWGAGGHDKLDISNVQIALEVYEQPTWAEWIATGPWEPGNYGNSAFPHPPLKQTICSDVLSRSELNKLIKVLKRARDAAYGSDE